MKLAHFALCAAALLCCLVTPPAAASRPRAQGPPAPDWTRGRFDEVEGLHVRRVEFLGNETTPHRVVNRAVGITEGDVFSPAALRRGLKRINALGLYYRVTERDVEWRRDPQYDLVDFVITLREKPRRKRR